MSPNSLAITAIKEEEESSKGIELHINGQNIRIFPCVVCHRSYSSRTALRRHYHRFMKDGVVKCQEELASKRRTKPELIFPFRCALCTKVYSLKSSLQRHVKNSHSKVTTSCLNCPLAWVYVPTACWLPAYHF